MFNAVAIKAPGFGERRKSLLQDIAIVTGAEYVAKDLGMKVETTGIESLGTARKVSLAFCVPLTPLLTFSAHQIFYPQHPREYAFFLNI